MNIFNKILPEVNYLIEKITALKEYKSHVVLPDIHLKPQMEAPSSFGVSTGKYIVPSLASAAINDGMSIIKLPFKASDLTDEIVQEFFREVNSNASDSKFKMNKYSLSKEEMINACLYGAKAVQEKFGLTDQTIENIELKGAISDGLTREDVKRIVPNALLSSTFSRAEFGLNFRGNHFLEMQKVGKINDKVTNAPEKMEIGDITMMTHLGPGPFSGNLMRLYSKREKIPTNYKPLYFAAKVYFHFMSFANTKLPLKEKFNKFLFPDKYEAFDSETASGKDLYKLLQIATNVGFAYQMGTFAAVKDGVKHIQKKYNLPKGEVKLIWNVSHNSIYFEQVKAEKEFVVRHNSVRLYNNKPTILAGSYDVCSCIGLAYDINQNKYMNTYDHGIGSILARLKEEDALEYGEEVSKRYYFKRDSGEIEKIKEAKLVKSPIMEKVANHFDESTVFQPWFYVDPIATLKN